MEHTQPDPTDQPNPTAQPGPDTPQPRNPEPSARAQANAAGEPVLREPFLLPELAAWLGRTGELGSGAAQPGASIPEAAADPTPQPHDAPPRLPSPPQPLPGGYQFLRPQPEEMPPPPKPRTGSRPWVHALLFVGAVVTTHMAGAELVSNRHWLHIGPPETWLGWHDLHLGTPYSFAFLLFLTCHEFGHYFAAMWHRVRSSLPYYIPIFLPIPGMINIGSFGAVIRLRDRPRTTAQYFDIGIAGPLAGFVVSLGVLVYGFLALPPLEYLYQMNPQYLEDFGGIPSADELLRAYGGNIQLGTSLLFEGLKWLLADPERMPNHFELFHYPWLFAGYITLFFTALNLLPIGQLDGGHVVYGLLGRARAAVVSRLAVLVLVIYGGAGITDLWQLRSTDLIWLGFYLLYLTYILAAVFGRERPLWVLAGIVVVLLAQQILIGLWPSLHSNPIWLVYALMTSRLLGLDHPIAEVEHRLNRPRRILGWVALAIFVLCFSPEPIVLAEPPDGQAVYTGILAAVWP